MVKKGRHRRYEEARKFQRESAQRFDVSDYDFDEDDSFGLSAKTESNKAEPDGDGHYDDQYSDLADKYNADEEFEPDTNGESG